MNESINGDSLCFSCKFYKGFINDKCFINYSVNYTVLKCCYYEFKINIRSKYEHYSRTNLIKI